MVSNTHRATLSRRSSRGGRYLGFPGVQERGRPNEAGNRTSHVSADRVRGAGGRIGRCRVFTSLDQGGEQDLKVSNPAVNVDQSRRKQLVHVMAGCLTGVADVDLSRAGHQFRRVLLINPSRIRPATSDGIALAEAELGVRMPPGYAAYVERLGESALGYFVRVYAPARLPDLTRAWRERVKEY